MVDRKIQHIGRIKAMMKNLTERELEIFKAGIAVGKKEMEDKIEKHYELGKPVLANGRLYWLKSDIDNLNDIMDDIETEWNESK